MAVVTVEFDQSVQPLDALNAAAYRLLGTATCQINLDERRFIVSIFPKPEVDGEEVRERFLATVTDENLRAQIAQRTEPVRNLILALAFGSLAHPPDPAS